MREEEFDEIDRRDEIDKRIDRRKEKLLRSHEEFREEIKLFWVIGFIGL